MTIGIVVACKDGVVIGADRKVVRSRGTRIKSLEDKIVKLQFRDGRNLLVCSSGGSDFARRAVEQIDPSDMDRDIDCSTYREIVESRISRLQSRLSDRGILYDADLLFGMIDMGNKPTIGHITLSGLTEMRNQGYFTTGIAAPYAELVLQDSYAPDMGIEDAKLIVAGLIERIGKVDNDVEGMDVFSISVTNKKVQGLTTAERRGIEQEPLSFNFKEELEDLRQAVSHWQQFFEFRKKRLAERQKKVGKPASEDKT